MLLRPSARLLAAAGALALATTLSSCGFNVATNRVYIPGVGVNEREASVDVLNAVVVSGQEGSGTFVGSFSNNDTLKKATVTSIKGAGNDASVTVQGSFPIKIGPGALVNMATDGDVILTGSSVSPGDVVTLDFAFGTGESVEVDVPVVPPCNEFAGLDKSASGSASTSPSSSGSSSTSSSSSSSSSPSGSASSSPSESASGSPSSSSTTDLCTQEQPAGQESSS